VDQANRQIGCTHRQQIRRPPAPRRKSTVPHVLVCAGVGLLSVGNGAAAQVRPGEVISETDLGVAPRLRQPQQIDARNILIAFHSRPVR